MKVPPKRTILIVIVNFFETTGEDNPLKRTPLCSQYRNWTAYPMFGGYLRPCTLLVYTYKSPQSTGTQSIASAHHTHARCQVA